MVTQNGMLCFVPPRLNNGKIDIEGCVEAARRAAEDFAAKDDALTVRLGEAALNVWREKPYASLRSCSPSALARMALTTLGMMPDDKACKDAEARVKLVVSGQPDKFLIVKSGPKKGIHYKERYSSKELEVLSAQK